MTPTGKRVAPGKPDAPVKGGGQVGARSGLLPWRSVWRQTRADAAPLALGVAVIAAATFLSVAVPQAMALMATEEVQTVVGAPDANTSVVVAVSLSGSEGESYELAPNTVDGSELIRDRVESGMPPELRAVLTDPVLELAGPELKAGAIDGRPGRVRFIYVGTQRGPAVEWVEGRAPGTTGTADDLLYADGGVLPIEVALSADAASLMGVHAGDRLPVLSESGQALEVRVSGIYRVSDPSDPAWAVAPTLVRPTIVEGSAAVASVGLYLSRESVPYARIAVFPTGLARTYTYAVDPQAFDGGRARLITTQARGLASGKEAFDVVGASPRVTTQLDRVLDGALARIDSATAQASVLLIGVLSIATLIELLAASLVAERRGVVLRQWRARGATLTAIGVAITAESALIVGLAGAAGLAAASFAVGGQTPWFWLVPPLVAAIVAPPWLALRVASGRSASVRSATRHRPRAVSGATPAQVRRLGAEVLLAVVAVGALLTLRSRGVTSSAGAVWSDVAVLAAPVLIALSVAVLVMRAQPRVLSTLRTLASRSRGAVPLLAAARTKASGTAVAALVTAGVIAAMAASVAGTVDTGQGESSWDAVGADAAASTKELDGLPTSVAALDGVDGLAAATATVYLGAQALGPRLDQSMDIIAIDSRAMARVLAMTPARDAPALEALGSAAPGADGAVPILVMGTDREWEGASLRIEGTMVPVARVGNAPTLPIALDDGRTVVIVDREALASSLGVEPAATLAWVSGPAASDRLTAALSDTSATTVSREGWLADRRAAPVARALNWVFAGAAAVAVALAALAVTLMAASGAWERTRAVAQIRVVGTPRRSAARVAWLEATLPAVAASVVGLAVGMALAGALVAALDLASVTGGASAPPLVISWWTLAIPLGLGIVARVAVALAALSHGRDRLGALMRVG